METLNHSFRWRDYTLYLAWLVAIVATFGSLYFSEVKGYIPCELCWYQRIFMYPLVILLGIAAYKQETAIKPYVLSLSIVGGLISFYHYLQQKVPSMTPIRPCEHGIPCNVEHINWLGFVTIPFLAFMAFALITVLMSFTKINANHHTQSNIETDQKSRTVEE